jgi:hemoglobin-like flavoprotein
MAIERKARVIGQIGVYAGWDGAVPPEQYSILSQKLEAAKEQFLDEEANTSEEREQWAKAWPFKSG